MAVDTTVIGPLPLMAATSVLVMAAHIGVDTATGTAVQTVADTTVAPATATPVAVASTAGTVVADLTAAMPVAEVVPSTAAVAGNEHS
jgi:hypothetical protein